MLKRFYLNKNIDDFESIFSFDEICDQGYPDNVNTKGLFVKGKID
jgi:hypothetical protein